jgi:hypothetical protein
MTEDSMNMSREELVDHLKKLAEPVDFEELERKGIIKKCGAWYQILDMNALPEVFTGLAKAMKIEKGRLSLKLEKQSEYEKLLKRL